MLTPIIIDAVFAFLSGAAWGVHESISHRYSKFKARVPWVSDQFWNPSVSWLNKYKNRDVSQGRKRFLGVIVPVQFTDAKHALGTIFTASAIIAGIFCGISINEGPLSGVISSIVLVGFRSLGNYLFFVKK